VRTRSSFRHRRLPGRSARRLIAGLLATIGAVTVVGACGEDQRADAPTTTTTTAADPGADSTTSTTDARNTTTSEAGSTTTGATTVTTVVPDDPLALLPTGIGTQRFGLAADIVVDALVDELGTPTDDRVEPALSSSIGVCPGTEVRVVEWGGFQVVFSDGDTPFALGGSFTFFDWRIQELGASTPPLQTPEGIDLGDTVADVRAAFGTRAELFTDDVTGPAFRVGTPPDVLRGSLSSTNDSGTVLSLTAGSSCGE
jgi:hypothetical protein